MNEPKTIAILLTGPAISVASAVNAIEQHSILNITYTDLVNARPENATATNRRYPYYRDGNTFKTHETHSKWHRHLVTASECNKRGLPVDEFDYCEKWSCKTTARA